MQVEKHYEVSFDNSNDTNNVNSLLSSWVIIIAILIGSVFVIIGSCMLYYGKYKQNICSESVIATIKDVEMRTSRDSDGDIEHYWYPTYAFELDGEYYEIDSTTGVGPNNPYDIGETIELKVNPVKPDQLYEAGNIPPQTMIGMIFLFVGGINEIVFTVVAYKIRKSRK